MTIFERIRRFDAYAKTADDFRTQTFTGGVGTPSILRVLMFGSDAGQCGTGGAVVSGCRSRLSVDPLAV